MRVCLVWQAAAAVASALGTDLAKCAFSKVRCAGRFRRFTRDEFRVFASARSRLRVFSIALAHVRRVLASCAPQDWNNRVAAVEYLRARIEAISNGGDQPDGSSMEPLLADDIEIVRQIAGILCRSSVDSVQKVYEVQPLARNSQICGASNGGVVRACVSGAWLSLV